VIRRLATAIAAIACLCSAASAGAATLQPIGNFEAPIYVTSDPGNPERLLVVERGGKIEEVRDGAVSTFADLSSLVGTEGEGGLLSIAPAPDFNASGRLFVDYTGEESPDQKIHVAELRASGTTAPIGSLRNLLTIEHPEDKNHYGGQLQFGPEGMLFISTGDGGGANDEHHNAQNMETGLGKVLRIDPNPSGTLPYTVPAGNPFAGVPGDYEPIWSLGLRNPFRFSFDRATGGLFIGDVGQSQREEVDFAAAPGLGGGANYGWNCMEGSLPGPGGALEDPQCPENAGKFVPPIFEYETHSEGRCAIIGGYVVRDPSLAGLYGRYLYGDLCTGQIRSFDPSKPAATDRPEGLTVGNLNSFGEDACGRLYAVSGNGAVSRLVGPEPADCSRFGSAPPPRALSFIGIKAHGRHVRRGQRALITAFVSPCAGRKGEPVKLFEGRRHLATRRLDRACTARFRPKIRHRTRFRAFIAEDSTYVAAISRKLRIAIDHRRQARRPGRGG
jgi:glucose/arabinose dehydrogenase